MNLFFIHSIYAIDQYILFRKQGKLFGGEEEKRLEGRPLMAV